MGKFHNLLKKGAGSHRRCGVIGIVEVQHPRLVCHLSRDLIEVDHPVVLGPHQHRVDLPPRDHRPPKVSRIGRTGHQHQIAGIHIGQGQMGQALFGSQQGQCLPLGIQHHPIAAVVPIGDGLPKTAGALKGGIAVVGGILDRQLSCRHHRSRRGAIRIAHTQINQIQALFAGSNF